MTDGQTTTRGSARASAELVLVRTASKAFAGARVMLARVHPSGLFELLAAGAWARALGYRAEELSGKLLRELMQLDADAARALAAALLDGTNDRPLDVTLQCKDRRRKRFRLYRRFDAYAASIFVLADELPFAAEQTGPVRASYDAADELDRQQSGRLHAGRLRHPVGQL